MGLLVLLGWIGAVVVTAVVLGFCAYELAWKSRRLRGDLDRLNRLSDSLAALQADIGVAQRRTQRAVAATRRPAGGH